VQQSNNILIMRIISKLIRFIILPIFTLVAIALVILAEKDIPREKLKPIYTNSSSQFMPLMGMNVHYRDEGNKNDSTPLILIHGMSSSLNTWDSLVILMKDKKRLISIDLPGFGLTGPNPENKYGFDYYSNFLDSFLTNLNIRNCIIAGNSMGGGVSWHYALSHPEKVNQLILIDAVGYQGKKGKGSLGFKLASMPVVNNLLLYITPKFLIKKSLETVFVNQTKITEKEIDRYHDLTIAEGNRKAALSIFKNGFVQEPEKIQSITTPTLIIWGDQDHLITVDNAYQFQKNIKGSELVVLKNVGHVPMEEVPGVVANSIFRFIR
jgi:pimeloyl-ACP methyl ester carboxylesterase